MRMSGLTLRENGWRNEITFLRNVALLVSERRFIFSDLDVFANAIVSGFIDDGADGDARLFRIADAQAGRGGEQSLHDAIVIFLEHDEARERGTFLALISEGGINRIDDRFVEIGIGIDDDGVLAAHFANDALQFALARRAFGRRFPKSAAPLRANR